MNDLYLRHYAVCKKLKQKIEKGDKISSDILKTRERYQVKLREDYLHAKGKRRRKQQEEKEKKVLADEKEKPKEVHFYDKTAVDRLLAPSP